MGRHGVCAYCLAASNRRNSSRKPWLKIDLLRSSGDKLLGIWELGHAVTVGFVELGQVLRRILRLISAHEREAGWKQPGFSYTIG